ncbi:transcriptional regulator, HxlR family [Mesorhizobium albiziae]|uniref:Transcriptional regulator, HxlR family n=2 Tax=Neomesorhizobium albiziae TaxID=335020 RepID=A0A1I4CBE8_9HYPH|nr:transcriptional regulator, HxlR family [Mesorhizobium albiziae]
MKKKVTMAKLDIFQQTLCPVARAESVVGDIWTVLVLRELFARNHRFDEIQVMTGATPQMLATRLKKLEADGLLERRLYNKRPPRYEYHLTDKGRDFWPVLMALRAWGEKWCRLPGEELSTNYVHQTCGHAAGLGPLCDHCGELLRHEELIGKPSRARAAELEQRRAVLKEGTRSSR